MSRVNGEIVIFLNYNHSMFVVTISSVKLDEFELKNYSSIFYVHGGKPLSESLSS